jgi:pimeloyl-ACP methyl ester carboxylesterase
MGKTIVFIHGAWLNSRSWEYFVSYFEGKGYTCITPEWPYKDFSRESMYANTPPELAKVGIKEITDHYEKIIRALSEPPLLIGHSIGGLIVQQLLDRGVGSAGVALSSVAPTGVFILYWTVIRANIGVLLTWRGWRKVVKMNLPNFQYAFANTLQAGQQRKYYERYVVPETGRVFFQIALAPVDFKQAIKVNFKNNTRAPLLLVAGEKDQLIPARIVKSNYKHYKVSTAKTDFHEFKGRSHLIVAQDGWEDVADYVLTWLNQQSSENLKPVG